MGGSGKNSLMSRSWTVTDDNQIFRDVAVDQQSFISERLSIGESSEGSTTGSEYTITENPNQNYDKPKYFSKALIENYDVPKNFLDGGYESLIFSECSCSSNLYATVDKSKKKTNGMGRFYENAKFAQSLENYENSKNFIGECSHCKSNNKRTVVGIAPVKTETEIINKFQSKTLDRTRGMMMIKPKSIIRSSSADFLEDCYSCSPPPSIVQSPIPVVVTESRTLSRPICRSMSIPVRINNNRDSTSSTDSGVYPQTMRRIRNIRCEGNLQDISFKFEQQCQINAIHHSRQRQFHYHRNDSSTSSATSDLSETYSMSSQSSIERPLTKF